MSCNLKGVQFAAQGRPIIVVPWHTGLPSRSDVLFYEMHANGAPEPVCVGVETYCGLKASLVVSR
jgi:hypothetical protein